MAMQKHELIGDVRGKACSRRLNLWRTATAKRRCHSECIKKFVDMAYERGLIVYSRRTRDGLVIIFWFAPHSLSITIISTEIITGLDATLVEFTRYIRMQMKAG
jgi:adenosylmethionine-8-amino-7-oxononanoate aminotransferase